MDMSLSSYSLHLSTFSPILLGFNIRQKRPMSWRCFWYFFSSYVIYKEEGGGKNQQIIAATLSYVGIEIKRQQDPDPTQRGKYGPVGGHCTHTG